MGEAKFGRSAGQVLSFFCWLRFLFLHELVETPRRVRKKSVGNRRKGSVSKTEGCHCRKTDVGLSVEAQDGYAKGFHALSWMCQKVEKHISKIEGVTSYKVDLESKMVVVIGDVLPLEVLESISKVKSAEIWNSS